MGLSVSVKGLNKTYRAGEGAVDVLRGVTFDLAAGECVSLMGPSGCGKSTLLHLLGMLDRPTTGSVYLDDYQVSHLPERLLGRFRNQHVGFVFQAHHLLPEHTALGNVMIPVRLGGGSVPVARARATALLDAVGLYSRRDHRPGELSGGEQQRVALARALVMGPELILADEPTGNLDPQTADGVFELMLRLNEELGSTLVVVTHSADLARRFARTLVFRDGVFVDA
jgi:lipoprotein-releasing system ATP-binding protein